jgi:hypothetical protein
MVLNMLKIDKNQCFYGTLIRGPKETVENFIEKQVDMARFIEKKNINENELLVRLTCLGYQIDCQTEKYKDLSIAIFTTLGSSASLFIKKAGDVSLYEYELGEMDSDNDYHKIYSFCPDKPIHEKYILSNCGEPLEFQYKPSEYIISMVSDNEIDENANTEPVAICEYLEECDEELSAEWYVFIK